MKIRKTKYKYAISETVFDLLKIYSIFDYEVGGGIFAKPAKTISGVSFKKGEKYHITFDHEDDQVFCLIKGSKLIGTWHSHHSFSNEPSSTDRIQWNKWKKMYLHFIINKQSLKVFNKKGDLQNEIFFEKK